MKLLTPSAALVFLLSLLPPSQSQATAQIPESESIKQISQSAEWHRLLHYEPTRATSRFESQVDDASFFLSEDGKQDPEAELHATLLAFNAPLENADTHAVCRYPARWQFLNKQLSLPKPALPLEQCPELNQWMNAIKPHSTTLVFASSYLNSPSSMFGHTFLRVDPKNVEQGSTWLSYAINFGAELNSEDNSILYAYKGLFGGYPGFFSVIRYYEKIKEYSRIENRDLWEYKLNLNSHETLTLMRHLWELRDVNFDYYFFDENCSYRLLELLEVARPGISLRQSFSHRAIPVDTVRSVINEGLLESVHYRPSVATKLDYSVQQLKEEEQLLAWRLARGRIDLSHEQLTNLETPARAAIISLAYEYLRYMELENRRTKHKAQYSLKLLRALNQLPISESTPVAPDYRPDQGHKTLLVGTTAGTHNSNTIYDLRLRLSYHDLEDNTTGYLKGAAINIGEIKLRKTAGSDLKLERFSLIDISSLSPRTAFLKPITWRVQTGLERIYGKADDRLQPQVHGGAGVSYNLGEPFLFYFLAQAKLEYNPLLKHNLAAGVGIAVGGLLHLPFATLNLESTYYHFTSGDPRYRHQLTQNIPLGRNNAVRLEASHEKQIGTHIDQFNLEFRHYF